MNRKFDQKVFSPSANNTVGNLSRDYFSLFWKDTTKLKLNNICLIDAFHAPANLKQTKAWMVLLTRCCNFLTEAPLNLIVYLPQGPYNIYGTCFKGSESDPSHANLICVSYSGVSDTEHFARKNPIQRLMSMKRNNWCVKLIILMTNKEQRCQQMINFSCHVIGKQATCHTELTNRTMYLARTTTRVLFEIKICIGPQVSRSCLPGISRLAYPLAWATPSTSSYGQNPIFVTDVFILCLI